MTKITMLTVILMVVIAACLIRILTIVSNVFAMAKKLAKKVSFLHHLEMAFAMMKQTIMPVSMMAETVVYLMSIKVTVWSAVAFIKEIVFFGVII